MNGHRNFPDKSLDDDVEPDHEEGTKEPSEIDESEYELNGAVADAWDRWLLELMPDEEELDPLPDDCDFDASLERGINGYDNEA